MCDGQPTASVWSTGDSIWYQLAVLSEMLPLILSVVLVEKLLNKATQAINAQETNAHIRTLVSARTQPFFTRKKKP